MVALSLPCAEHSQLLKFVHAVGEETRCVFSKEGFHGWSRGRIIGGVSIVGEEVVSLKGFTYEVKRPCH